MNNMYHKLNNENVFNNLNEISSNNYTASNNINNNNNCSSRSIMHRVQTSQGFEISKSPEKNNLNFDSIMYEQKNNRD